MSDSTVPAAGPSPVDPSPPDDTLPDGPSPDQGGGEPWTVRIRVKVLALVGALVAALLVAVLVVTVVVNRGPDSPTEVVNDFVAAAEAGDLERFESQMCAPVRQLWRELPAEEQLKNLGDIRQIVLTMGWRVVQEEIEPGGDRATVMYTYTDETGQAVVNSFHLNREDGQWKVCG